MLTIVNKLTVTGDRAEFERLLGEITGYMKSRPGFVSHTLYKSLKDENVLIETGTWESREAHAAALQGAGFRDRVGLLMKHATAEFEPCLEIPAFPAGQ
ncbi:antibiotic biosynthesis monooxygenase family protein [Kitasatospora sp. NPDC096140]|uniref:antibiotic biosynthesis monooxygenase family protein n=1 Tax=unclassified Kitasatospora TaxID=2633591 RepID=UPI003332CF51